MSTRRSELEATRDSHLHQRSKFTTTTGKSVELRKPEVSNRKYIPILLLILNHLFRFLEPSITSLFPYTLAQEFRFTSNSSW